MPIPTTIPKKNPASAKIKNISVEIKKQKLNKRGNINRKKFLECSASSVLNTVGEVTTKKELITPKSSAFVNILASKYMTFKQYNNQLNQSKTQTHSF